MTDEATGWYLDLIAMVVYTGVVGWAVLESPPPGVRAALAVPLVLLLPGYAVVAALFPARTSRQNVESAALDPRRRSFRAALPRNYGVSGVERLALSVVVSVALVPLLALAVDASPLALRPRPLFAAVAGAVVAATLVAFVRRARTDRSRRFSPLTPVALPRDIEASGSRRLVFDSGGDPTDWAIRALLALSVLALAGSVAFAATVPPPDEERFTEVYLVAGDGDGDLTTAAVPRQYTENRSASLVLGITNHEHRSETYDVVVTLQRVDDGRVTDERRLTGFSVSAGHGETRRYRHQVRPTMSGDDLRLTYLVYRAGVPATPTVDNAYREVHVDVTVAPAPSSETRDTPRGGGS